MARLAVAQKRSRADFLPAPGWSVTRSVFPWGDDEEAQVVWATNVTPASADAAVGWPIATVRQLSPDGIVVCASMAPNVEDGPSLYPERSRPLRLAEGTFFSGQYENQAASNVSVYRIAGHLRDQYVTAEVFFGVPNPASALLQAAEAQLSRLVVGEQ